jgi:hypothetical protein
MAHKGTLFTATIALQRVMVRCAFARGSGQIALTPNKAQATCHDRR